MGAQAVSTWATRSASDTNAYWVSVCWSGELGLFCAVSGGGTSNRVMTSPDGITWSNQTASDTSSIWQSVCWSAFPPAAASRSSFRTLEQNSRAVRRLPSPEKSTASETCRETITVLLCLYSFYFLINSHKAYIGRREGPIRRRFFSKQERL